MVSRELPLKTDLTVLVPALEHPGGFLSLPLSRTVIDANLLSWVGGGLAEALLAAREGMRLADPIKTTQRERLEALVEEAISVLDRIDGDADLEDDEADCEDNHDEEEPNAGPFQGGTERAAN